MNIAVQIDYGKTWDIEITRLNPELTPDDFMLFYCGLLSQGYQVTILNSLGVFGSATVLNGWIPDYYVLPNQSLTTKEEKR